MPNIATVIRDQSYFPCQKENEKCQKKNKKKMCLRRQITVELIMYFCDHVFLQEIKWCKKYKAIAFFIEAPTDTRYGLMQINHDSLAVQATYGLDNVRFNAVAATVK